MASPELPFFQSPPPTLRHLHIPTEPLRMDAAAGRSARTQFQRVDRREHGQALVNRLQAISQELSIPPTAEPLPELPRQLDLVLEIDSAPGFPMSAGDIHAITTGSGIELLYAAPAQTA